MALTLHQTPEDQTRRAVFAPLAEGGLHEIYASAEADGASLCALALMLTQGCGKRFRLWIRHEAQAREAGTPYPLGLAELGLHPAEMLFFQARNAASALQAGLEGARCAGLGAVIVELRGEARAYDLVASRRLALAAKASGAAVVLARVAAAPAPSAAQTRWRARPIPSRALAARAPGPPAFEMTLLRARNGQEGLRYCVEWDRDARQFIPRSIPLADDAAGRSSPLSGPVAPVSANRSGSPWRQAG